MKENQNGFLKAFKISILVLGIMVTLFCAAAPLVLLCGIAIITFAIIFWQRCSKIEGEITRITTNAETEAKEIISEAEIKAKETTAEAEEKAAEMGAKIEHLDSKIIELEGRKKLLQKEIRALNADYSEKSIFFVGLEEREDITSEEIKNKISMLKLEQSKMVQNNKAVVLLDGIEQKEKKTVLNNNIKQISKCFISETAFILSNVTVRNIDTSRNKIIRSFELVNSIFKNNHIKLSDEFLEAKLKELNLYYSYLLKLEQEKEEQREIRQQMLEEEKARREIEREKLKLDKEEKQFHNEIDKLMAYIQKADSVEKQLYVDKIHELEAKLKDLEKDKNNLLEREKSTRAGHVYIISNIGSFGEDVYKIGMTRRLEPMDRVKELGDASVPFEFDVHAMIFSEDAPALESILHNAFKDNQVNKVNPRKEFFRVSLDEIEALVKKEYNATVKFTKVAQADQYRRSLAIASQA